MAFTNIQTGNYENINNIDRSTRNQHQFQQLNGQTSSANSTISTTNKNYLNSSGSLNYNQSNNSSQFQLMGLPTTPNNTMQSRTNCSSPASNSSSITTKSSPTTAGNLASNFF